MNQARTLFRVYTSNTNIRFRAHGGSFTNRGTSVATINGVVELQPKESFSLAVVDEETYYDQDFEVGFAGEGNNKLVVQEIAIRRLGPSSSNPSNPQSSC